MISLKLRIQFEYVITQIFYLRNWQHNRVTHEQFLAATITLCELCPFMFGAKRLSVVTDMVNVTARQYAAFEPKLAAISSIILCNTLPFKLHKSVSFNSGVMFKLIYNVTSGLLPKSIRDRFLVLKDTNQLHDVFDAGSLPPKCRE